MNMVKPSDVPRDLTAPSKAEAATEAAASLEASDEDAKALHRFEVGPFRFLGSDTSATAPFANTRARRISPLPAVN